MRKPHRQKEHAIMRNGMPDSPGMPRARGKPEAFTDAENRAMRFILRNQYDYLKKVRKVANQTEMGVLLGVGQQAAGKLLGSGEFGFSRPTALRLAQICGFDSPETLLRELGKNADAAKAPTGWWARDLAARHARDLGYSDSAINRVIAKFTEERHATMPARWWAERIMAEQAEQEAEKAAAPPPSTPMPVSIPVLKKARKQRRG